MTKVVGFFLNPPFFMLLGTTFYILVPSFLFFYDYFGLDFVRSVVSGYSDINSSLIYMHNVYDFLIINLCFSSGYLFAFFFNNHKRDICNLNRVNRESNLRLTQGSLSLFLFLVLSTILVKARLTGYQFFSGYSTYDISFLGPLATLCFMSMWFYIYFNRNVFLILFFLSGVLLLGSGSRMFFFLPLISLMLNSVLIFPQRAVRYFFVFFLSLFLMLLIGLLREGSAFSLDGLLSILFAEPVFTSIGTLFYFSQGRPDLGLPVDIIAALINFIPSFIFPDKQILLSSLVFDEEIHNPLGAQSLLINLYKNFGWFYPFFMITFGVYFGLLYKYKANKVAYTVYVMSLPLILFHFQREGFITVFKVLFLMVYFFLFF